MENNRGREAGGKALIIASYHKSAFLWRSWSILQTLTCGDCVISLHNGQWRSSTWFFLFMPGILTIFAGSSHPNSPWMTGNKAGTWHLLVIFTQNKRLKLRNYVVTFLIILVVSIKCPALHEMTGMLPGNQFSEEQKSRKSKQNKKRRLYFAQERERKYQMYCIMRLNKLVIQNTPFPPWPSQ